MSVKGLDTPEIIGSAKAVQLYNYNVRGIGVYLRKDRAPLSMVQSIHSAGIKIWSIWEKGNPTDPSYFTAAAGLSDGLEAAWYAESILQPSGSIIFPAIDYDSSPKDVELYVQNFHKSIKANGYLLGLYGNGLTLAYFSVGDPSGLGYSHAGYLDESTGQAGYKMFLPDAAIIQHYSPNGVDGLNADLCTVVNEGVLW